MTSTGVKPRHVSRPSFARLQDQGRTPTTNAPGPFLNDSKPRRDAPSSRRRSSNRVSKHKVSEKQQSPTPNLAESFAASLDQHRNDIQNSVASNLGNVEKGLLTSLADLTTDLDHHFEELVKIEEPLQKPFDTEILSIRTTTVGDDGKGSQQEVLLQDRIANFRRLREEKEKALCRLWDEWEDTQFQLIRLPAEVLGAHSMTFAQNCEEDMKPGQKSRLDDALRLDPGGPQEEVAPHESLEQDLEAFQEQMHQISTKTKKTVTEMQQQYNVQKNKLFKGLHRHIELLAAL